MKKEDVALFVLLSLCFLCLCVLPSRRRGTQLAPSVGQLALWFLLPCSGHVLREKVGEKRQAAFSRSNKSSFKEQQVAPVCPESPHVTWFVCLFVCSRCRSPANLLNTKTLQKVKRVLVEVKQTECWSRRGLSRCLWDGPPALVLPLLSPGHYVTR